MALQLQDLVAERGRRGSAVPIAFGANTRCQRRRMRSQSKQIRCGFVMQLMGDRLTLLVLRVEQPLDQPGVVRTEVG